MLRWALIFFVVALVAAVFGFLGIAAGSSGCRENPVLHLPGSVLGFVGWRISAASLIERRPIGRPLESAS